MAFLTCSVKSCTILLHSAGEKRGGGLGTRLGWRPGNEAGVETWERGWGGDLGTRLGWRPGNEAGVETWERGS